MSKNKSISVVILIISGLAYIYDLYGMNSETKSVVGKILLCNEYPIQADELDVQNFNIEYGSKLVRVDYVFESEPMNYFTLFGVSPEYFDIYKNANRVMLWNILQKEHEAGYRDLSSQYKSLLMRDHLSIKNLPKYLPFDWFLDKNYRDEILYYTYNDDLLCLKIDEEKKNAFKKIKKALSVFEITEDSSDEIVSDSQEELQEQEEGDSIQARPNETYDEYAARVQADLYSSNWDSDQFNDEPFNDDSCEDIEEANIYI